MSAEQGQRGGPWTPKEVAAQLRCHRKTILRALRAGELDGFHVGREWRISQAALESYQRGSGGGVEEITRRRLALVRTAVNGGQTSFNEVVAETGLRRTIVQDCLRRLGYLWDTGDGALRKGAP